MQGTLNHACHVTVGRLCLQCGFGEMGDYSWAICRVVPDWGEVELRRKVVG
jgi:hypothetical protein